DIITFAKGVTSGQAPLGGVLFTDDVAAPLLDQKAVYAHGFTFGGHPLSCAVALANLDIMERLDVLANVRALEDHLGAVLDDVASRSPIVAEARGFGFFRAIELRDAGNLAAADLHEGADRRGGRRHRRRAAPGGVSVGPGHAHSSRGLVGEPWIPPRQTVAGFGSGSIARSARSISASGISWSSSRPCRYAS